MKNAHLALFIALIVLGGVYSANAHEVFAIHKDGTGRKELTKGFHVLRVRVSLDGSQLVFSAGFNDRPSNLCGAIAGAAIAFNSEKLFLMNSDGSDLREIYVSSNVSEPVFTSDGKKILFTRWDDPAGTSAGACNVGPTLPSIYSINLDGTGAELIAPGAILLNISSDGSEIVFRKAGAGLYISNADGSDAKQLVGSGGAIGAAFNPRHSSEMMFYELLNPLLDVKIFTMNLNTLSRNIVLQGPRNLYVTGADYSPDGTTVLYSARTPTDFESEIYEVAANGTGVRQITFSDSFSHAMSATYSPDGKTIVFAGMTPIQGH